MSNAMKLTGVCAVVLGLGAAAAMAGSACCGAVKSEAKGSAACSMTKAESKGACPSDCAKACCAGKKSETSASASETKEVVLCAKCGEIAGGEKCCAADAVKCEKCGLHKGSPGCCKPPKS